MTDQTVLITGATSGMGREAAITFSRHGYHVVAVGRDQQRTDDVVAQFAGPGEALIADLSSLEQTRRLADEFFYRYDKLDLLVNAVGGVFSKRQESHEGYELHLALNHLSPFVLTNQVWPVLDETAAKSGGTHVVNVGSSNQKMGVNWDDPQFRSDYSFNPAYGSSKALMFMSAAHRASEVTDNRVRVNTMHPGAVNTDILSQSNSRALSLPMRIAGPTVFSSAATAGQRIFDVATDSRFADQNGAYINKTQVADPQRKVADPADWAKAWSLTERLLADPTL